MSKSVYDIPGKLFDLSEFYSEDSSHNDLVSHVIFVHLYRNVTREWIFYAENVGSRDLIFAIIERFYEKYIKYVKGPLDDVENCLPPCHWEKYFQLVSTGKPLQRLTDFLDVVNAGAYAHTRYDLAEAIAETLKEHHDIVGSRVALENLKQDLIGSPTNDVFGRASSGFFASILDTSTGTFPRGVGLVSALNVGVVQVVWMRKFQLWRALAWQDALASLGAPSVSLSH